MKQDEVTSSTPFFVAGGTVPPGSPSYVERAADLEIFEALRDGEYCYVLNSRQMGKSSLAVRTVSKLNGAGIRTAFVDLTRVGGANVTAEQWYAGLLVETGRVLDLRQQAVAYLRDHRELGPAQRFLTFLHEVALPASPAPLVVMVDEIDATRSLSFSTDEFFAGIRQLHNGRATEPELGRLTFCLLGAALPGDLIRDPRSTPFNVGRRVELRDFTLDEASPFAGALGPNGTSRLARILYWTGGQPFLTQMLCAELAAEPAGEVDAKVRERYLDERARESDSNLADVGNRLLGRGDPKVGDSERADTLTLYGRLQKIGIQDDESNPSAARIKMSGVARLEGGRLTLRNRIYGSVFDARWIRSNMPEQESRRQRNAFFLGVLRASVVSAAVIIVVSALAIIASRNADRANLAELKDRRKTYAATMRNMIQNRDQHNLFLINKATEELRDDPWRGWEWDYWHRVANRATLIVPLPKYHQGSITPSPDGNFAFTDGRQGIGMIDLESGRTLWTLPQPIDFFTNSISWFRDSRRLLAFSDVGEIRILDALSGRVLKSAVKVKNLYRGYSGRILLPGDRTALVATAGNRPAILDLDKLAVEELPTTNQNHIGGHVSVSLDGKVAVMDISQTDGNYIDLGVWDLMSKRFLRSIHLGEPINGALLANDGRTLAVGTNSGKVALIDIVTGAILDSKRCFHSWVPSLSFSNDDKLLGACANDRDSILFDVRGGKLFERQRYQESNDAGILPSGKQFFTVFWDLRLYDSDMPPEVPALRLPTDYYSGTITDDGRVFASSGTMEFHFTVASQPQISGLRRDAAKSIDDNGHLVVRTLSDRFEVSDLATGKLLLSQPHGDFVSLRFVASSDGRYVALSDDPKTLGIVNLGSTEPCPTIHFDVAADAGCFSPKDDRLAVSLVDGSISMYRVSDGAKLWTMNQYGFDYNYLSFSPDGHSLGACNRGDTADIFNANTGGRTAHLLGHAQAPDCMAWSPDGRRLATSGSDATIHIWDPSTGADLGIIGRHMQNVQSVRFLPGGHTLASFSSDGVLKLWLTRDDRP